MQPLAGAPEPVQPPMNYGYQQQSYYGQQQQSYDPTPVAPPPANMMNPYQPAAAPAPAGSYYEQPNNIMTPQAPQPAAPVKAPTPEPVI